MAWPITLLKVCVGHVVITSCYSRNLHIFGILKPACAGQALMLACYMLWEEPQGARQPEPL